MHAYSLPLSITSCIAHWLFSRPFSCPSAVASVGTDLPPEACAPPTPMAQASRAGKIEPAPLDEHPSLQERVQALPGLAAMLWLLKLHTRLPAAGSIFCLLRMRKPLPMHKNHRSLHHHKMPSRRHAYTVQRCENLPTKKNGSCSRISFHTNTLNQGEFALI
jgi:hypothetical protein